MIETQVAQEPTVTEDTIPPKSSKKMLKILIIVGIALVVIALAVVFAINHNKKVVEEQNAYLDSILSEENLYGTWKLTISPDPEQNMYETEICFLRLYEDSEGNSCCETDYFEKYFGGSIAKSATPWGYDIYGDVKSKGKVSATLHLGHNGDTLSKLQLFAYSCDFDKFSENVIYLDALRIANDEISISRNSEIIMERVQTDQYAESVLDIYDYAGGYEELGVDGLNLIIFAEDESSCYIDISMYRLGEFAGHGELGDTGLIFHASSGNSWISGQITLNSTADIATVEITDSDFPYIEAGDIFEYGKTLSADEMIAQ